VKDFSLRPVDASDDAFLFQLYVSTREDIAALLPPGLPRDTLLRVQWTAQRLDYAARYGQARHALVLVGGEPVGRLWVARLAGELRLVDVALLPHFRGTGLGTELVRALQAEASEAGLPLRLSVARDNPAWRLYARLGFTQVGAAEPDAPYAALEWMPPPRAS
jgi:ribosomal protein S18 acetylase RimI-like enzyme